MRDTHYIGENLYCAGARYSAGEVACTIPALYRDHYCIYTWYIYAYVDVYLVRLHAPSRVIPIMCASRRTCGACALIVERTACSDGSGEVGIQPAPTWVDEVYDSEKVGIQSVPACSNMDR